MLENTLLVTLSWENVETLLWCVLFSVNSGCSSINWSSWQHAVGLLHTLEILFCPDAGILTSFIFGLKRITLRSVNNCTFELHAWLIITISFPHKVSKTWPRNVWDSTLFNAIRCGWKFKIILGICLDVFSQFESHKKFVFVCKIISPFTSVPTVLMFTRCTGSVFRFSGFNHS